MIKKLPVSGLLMASLFLLSCTAFAVDWPCWRGPDKTGISSEKNWDPEALRGAPKIQWETNVGIGYSAVSIKGDRLYTMGSKKTVSGPDTSSMDIVFCLDRHTGKENWRYAYPCADGSWPGTRSTPTIDGDYIYTLSREGDLYCFEATTGKVVWKRNIISDRLAAHHDHGLACSPVIHDDLIILSAGESGLAVHKKTGDIIWKSEANQSAFSTSTLYQMGDQTRAAILGRDTLYSVNANTGEVAWSFPWKSRYDENSTDPILAGNHLFVSTLFNKGSVLLELTGKEPKVVWETKEMCNRFHSSVIVDGYIFGVHNKGRNNSLRCLDFKTGKVLWSQKFGFGTMMAADHKLIIMTEDGVLHIVEASPRAFREISSAKVIRNADNTGRSEDSKCRSWTVPVLSEGQIFVRNSDGDLACVDVRTGQ